MAFPKVGVEAVVQGFGTFMNQADQVDRKIKSMGRTSQTTAKQSSALGRAMGGLGGFLGKVGTIAGGILAAQIFSNIARQLKSVATESWNVAAGLQQLGVRFETLAAREALGANEIDEYISRLDAMDKTARGGALSLYQENRVKALRLEWDRLTGIMAKATDEGNAGLPYYQRLADYIIVLEEQMVKAIPQWEKLSPQMQKAAFGGLEMAEALEAAKQPAQDMLDWAINFSLTTPFKAQTVSDILAMGMGYGFMREEAEGLTHSIGEFTAGMGLSDDHMVRIIQNFGQMQSAGKVTGTELRDLARGAFLPVNDILHRMQENMGMGGLQFDKFKKDAAKGIHPVGEFFVAFSQIVDEQFAGSMERMAGTWAGATTRAGNFITTILGAGVLGPILERASAGLNSLLETLLTPENRQAAENLGMFLGDVWDSLADILTTLGIEAPTLKEILDNLSISAIHLRQFLDTFNERLTEVMEGEKTWGEFFASFSEGAVEWSRTALTKFADLILSVFGIETTWDEVLLSWQRVFATIPAALFGTLVLASQGAINIIEGIGNLIAAGIKAGIEQAWPAFISWYMELMDSLWQAVEDILKTDSPSKVFADIGKNVVKGLEVGIKAERLAPAKAIEGAVGGMMQAAMAPTAVSGAIDNRQVNTGDINIGGAEMTPLQFDLMMRDWIGA